MSTNKTPNLNLHSWVLADYVLMSEMNENFTTIDSKLNQGVKTTDAPIFAGVSFNGSITMNPIATGATQYSRKIILNSTDAANANQQWFLQNDPTGVLFFSNTTGANKWQVDQSGHVTMAGRLVLNSTGNGIIFGNDATASNNFHIVSDTNGGARAIRFYNGNYGAGIKFLEMGTDGVSTFLKNLVVQTPDLDVGFVVKGNARPRVSVSADNGTATPSTVRMWARESAWWTGGLWANMQWNGAYSLDDTTKAGWGAMFDWSADTFNIMRASAGANPRTLTSLFLLDSLGNATIPGNFMIQKNSARLIFNRPSGQTGQQGGIDFKDNGTYKGGYYYDYTNFRQVFQNSVGSIKMTIAENGDVGITNGLGVSSTVGAVNYTGRQLYAYGWADVSSGSDGLAVFGTNVYKKADDNTLKYSQTHPTFGARGIVMDWSKTDYIDRVRWIEVAPGTATTADGATPSFTNYNFMLNSARYNANSTNTNLNNFTLHGFYRNLGVSANLPSGYTVGDNDFHLLVEEFGDVNWIRQTLWDIRSNRMFTRSRTNATWNGWEELATLGSNQLHDRGATTVANTNAYTGILNIPSFFSGLVWISANGIENASVGNHYLYYVHNRIQTGVQMTLLASGIESSAGLTSAGVSYYNDANQTISISFKHADGVGNVSVKAYYIGGKTGF